MIKIQFPMSLQSKIKVTLVFNLKNKQKTIWSENVKASSSPPSLRDNLCGQYPSRCFLCTSKCVSAGECPLFYFQNEMRGYKLFCNLSFLPNDISWAFFQITYFFLTWYYIPRKDHKEMLSSQYFTHHTNL